MEVLSTLWFLFFNSIVASAQVDRGKTHLAWLPFRPVAIGLWAGTVILVSIAPAGAVLVLKGVIDLPTTAEIACFALIVSVFGLISYWAPIAYFVRKFAGDKIKISLI